MYRSITADQYRQHLGFDQGYKVDAMLCYGTLYEERVLSQLTEVLKEMGIDAQIRDMPDKFLRFAKEITIGNKRIWFAIGYGGAWLSEYLHWACLFGSKKNVLLGSCGGLKSGIKQGDFIVPESSYAEESSAKIYNRDTNIHEADSELSDRLAQSLRTGGATVLQGPTVTCQAMIGETFEDVKKWSAEGYFGVEMEASTVFAVSKHFNVPAAASLYVGDNLIEDHHAVSDEYIAEADMRNQKQLQQIKMALTEILRD